MIDGVVITALRCIPDERGTILHMLRSDEPGFEQFGEIYFSQVFPGVIKGWHLHRKMVLNYAVPVGRIKLVLYDPREDSPTHGEVQELFVGEGNYVRVRVPAQVWNGFKGVGTATSLVANCASIPHTSDEIIRSDPHINSIPYRWDLRHG